MKRLIILISAGMFFYGCGDNGNNNGNGGGETINLIGNISGHSYFAGTTVPVSGVLVSIGDITNTTGSDGYFSLANIPIGQQTITASKTNYDPYSSIINVKEGENLIDLEMTSAQETRTLSGTVCDPKGIPIAGAIIMVLNPDGSDSALYDNTDSIGHYQITSVPQGTRKVQFEHIIYGKVYADIAIANTDKIFNVILGVDEDKDGYASKASGGDDCDDTDSSVRPGAIEVCGDGIDQNCDGRDLHCSDADIDGDGYSINQEDCDDNDFTRYPGATETFGDNIDQNCDGVDGIDADGDGYASIESGGDDCDDTESSVNPGGAEICGDSVDQDCSGADLSCDDMDDDGYASESSGGDDCDDSDSNINPGSTEIADNGIDEDCDCGDLRTTCSSNERVDMGSYYIDKYEASRPDATSSCVGYSNTKACSVAGVLPWVSVNWNDAEAACQASGKRLCAKDEWGDACDGTIGEGGNTYPYGDDYQASTCNGNDAGNDRAMPTGDMSGCTSDYGVYDMSGNVWEWTDELSGDYRVIRGGSWDNGSNYLACSYRDADYPTGTGGSIGFRCCQDK